MKRKPKIFLASLMALMLSLSSSITYAEDASGTVPDSVTGVEDESGAITDSEISAKVTSMQIPFIQNQGQCSDQTVKFYADTFAGTVSVTDNGIIYSLCSKDEDDEIETCNVQESLVGTKTINPIGVGLSQTTVNSYIGNDSSKWQTNIPAYDQIGFKEVYNSIDLTLKAYGNNVEKIFTVQPGGNPEDICFELNGVNSLTINEKGELEIETDLSNIAFTAPIAYQVINDKKIDVEVNYILKGSSYGFSVGTYNNAYPLVIDPLLSGTFGVSDNNTGQHFTSIPMVVNGDYIYAAGYSSYNVAVYKFSKDLKTCVIKIIGGSETDYPIDISVDPSNGNIFITGETESADYDAATRFPVTDNVFTNARPDPDEVAEAETDSYVKKGYQRRRDVFVLKLNGTNLDMIASTTFGSTAHDSVTGIALDSNGNVFLTGASLAVSWANGDYFPFTGEIDENGDFISVTTGAATIASGSYIMKLSNNLNGGEDGEGNPIITSPIASVKTAVAGGCLEISSDDKIYLGKNGSDVIVSKLNNDMTAIEASITFGGSQQEYLKDMAIDTSGNVYVTGFTKPNGNFPTTVELAPHDTVNSTYYDMFVAKLPPNLSAVSSSIQIGALGKEDCATSLALDNDNVYITGYSASSFSTTEGAYKSSLSGSNNIVVFKIDQAFTEYKAATFIAPLKKYNPIIAIDNEGSLFISGYTDKNRISSVPVTEGTYDTESGGWAIFRLTDDLLSYWPTDSTLTVTDISNCTADLSWTAAKGNPSYTIYNVTENGKELLANVDGTSTYHLTGLISSITYNFKVEAGDPNYNNWSDDGPSCIATTENDTTSPIWPSNSKVVISKPTTDGCTLNWTEATDNVIVNAYKIYANNYPIAEVSGDVLNYTVNGLAKDKPYTFRIEAVDADGNCSTGGPSNTFTLNAVTLNLSKSVCSIGDTITASGYFPASTEIAVKLTDIENDIIFFDTTTSNEDGNYSIDFVIPETATSPLTITVGDDTLSATGKLYLAGDSFKYTVTAKSDSAYSSSVNAYGITCMTVNSGFEGFTYFAVNATPVISHEGNEVFVFVHIRDGKQIEINATTADFDTVGIAKAGFNVQAGDIVKAYLVDDLTNDINKNPIILQ